MKWSPFINSHMIGSPDWRDNLNARNFSEICIKSVGSISAGGLESVGSIPAGGPIVGSFFSTVPGLNLSCV